MFPRLGLPYWSVPSKNRMAYEGFYALGREATETARPALTALATNVPSGTSVISSTNTTPAAFWAGGVLWALDRGPISGGFDVCIVIPPMVFPEPKDPAPTPFQLDLRLQTLTIPDP
jgi:hypothetical protein